jgi:hypothetical protein
MHAGCQYGFRLPDEDNDSDYARLPEDADWKIRSTIAASGEYEVCKILRVASLG